MRYAIVFTIFLFLFATAVATTWYVPNEQGTVVTTSNGNQAGGVWAFNSRNRPDSNTVGFTITNGTSQPVDEINEFKWIMANSDDGTEVNNSVWFEDGIKSYHNYMGRNGNTRYDVGFRFGLGDLNQGEEVVYARLRFVSWGGYITSAANLLIEGVLQASPTTFSQNERPSQKLPKTGTKISWNITEEWFPGHLQMPLYYSSPDISPIINEIVSLNNWGSGHEGRPIVITIRDNGSNSNETNVVCFDDFKSEYPLNTPTKLEVYMTAYDTFLGKELLGRVTDTSVTVNLYSVMNTDTYIEYGLNPGVYTQQSELHLDSPAEEGIEIVLDNLLPDMRYYYRLACRKAGTGQYELGEERTFHTQRSEGESFSFAINADEHMHNWHRLPIGTNDTRKIDLYKVVLQNIADCNPDFLISLGDFAFPQDLRFDAPNLAEAKERYLLERRFIDPITHSIPFFLVVGNHEGEQGWRYLDPDDDLAVLGTLARKELIPNPFPDGFYTGNTDVFPEFGLREDYFAWEWGDALFVAIDPIWYTERKPHDCQGTTGSHDAWDWTLGHKQYNWLYETLHNSDAKWKFVFIHHLTSAVVSGYPEDKYTAFYGRGGIEVAKYKVDGRPSFEWGGEDENGNDVFAQKRPGWSHGPIHDMLVDANVTIVFHGHDHCYAMQELDGIIYQLCPVQYDATYQKGFAFKGCYSNGVIRRNSGHMLITVGPYDVTVDYIRGFLPGDGINGTVSHSYTIR